MHRSVRRFCSIIHAFQYIECNLNVEWISQPTYVFTMRDSLCDIGIKFLYRDIWMNCTFLIVGPCLQFVLPLPYGHSCGLQRYEVMQCGGWLFVVFDLFKAQTWPLLGPSSCIPHCLFVSFITLAIVYNKQTNYMVFSPQRNYTDRAAAAGWRS
jgi:hypothetical protein